MGRKMDQHLQSKQKHEISYWRRKYKVSAPDVREAMQAVGRSRDAIMKYLIENGKVAVKIEYEFENIQA